MYDIFNMNLILYCNILNEEQFDEFVVCVDWMNGRSSTNLLQQ